MSAHQIFFKVLTWWHLRLLLLFQIPALGFLRAENVLPPQTPPPWLAHGSFTRLGRLPGTNQLQLSFNLPVRNPAGLSNLLAAIYNPASPQFHHYLKPGEFAARFGPTPEDYQSVVDFARTNGLTVTRTYRSRLLVDVAGKAADVERTLHLRFSLYRHPAEARNFFAPDSEPALDPLLPSFRIGGLNSFSLPHPGNHFQPHGNLPRPTPCGGSSPDGNYMGSDFRQAYVPGTPLTGAGQSVALLEFDAFDPQDITNYETLIGLTNTVPGVVVQSVDGGVSSPGASQDEVTLDIDLAMAMAPGLTNIYVYEAPLGNTWADILGQIADDDLAAQIGCSWRDNGPDRQTDALVEPIFLQMAAQGQSVFVACGDMGAYSDVVPFPCSSPNVTQVGGTSLATDTNGDYLAETVWNGGPGHATGGGACPGIPIPNWQLGLDLTASDGSTVCRNIPDVAMVADSVYIIVGGQPVDKDGTSCAAPLWAGFTALINQQAAQLGQSPVGFLNPAIYDLCRGTNYPALFHDITDGGNTNNSSTNYYAVPGYDLCTGWGTPAGTNLINALTMPESLGILPPVDFSAYGLVGGPISQTNWIITLTNSGAGPLDWALGAVPVWLAISPAVGTLAAGASTNVSAQLLNPNGLASGYYYTVMDVTNLDLSTVQNVSFEVAVGESIVQNGGFETGDFTGWILVGDTVIGRNLYNVVTTDGSFPGIAYSGYFGAFLGEGGYAATLSQTLATVPGQQYLISYWLDNLVSGNGQYFSVSWDGNTLDDLTLTNPPSFQWTNIQYVVMADNTNTVLQFAAENDRYGFFFDDVSVTPVPLAIANYNFSTNGFQFTWPSRAGLNYLVQYKTNLTQAGWMNLCTCPAWTNYDMVVDTNCLDGDQQRFYRLTLAP